MTGSNFSNKSPLITVSDKFGNHRVNHNHYLLSSNVIGLLAALFLLIIL